MYTVKALASTNYNLPSKYKQTKQLQTDKTVSFKIKI